MENGSAIQTDGQYVNHHDDGDEQMKIPSGSNDKPNGHRRSFSNSILSRLNFLRTSQEEPRPSLEEVQDAINETDTPTNHLSETGVTNSQKAIKGRKRKGSLRKTALLGTGKFKAESRERRNSILQRRPSLSTKQVNGIVLPSPSDEIPQSEAVQALRRELVHEASLGTTSDGSWSVSDPGSGLQSLDLGASAALNDTQVAATAPALGSPIKSPTSQSYGSTTDEEEALSFSRPATGHTHPPTLKSQPSSSGSSYFPPQQSITRRRSTTKPGLSPLSALPMDAYSQEEEWDYSETEWWGWVVLVVTWIVFVVGMGSCLGIWSWAWDVGQTPYAPPELEDDPTLPIVGYYPALIILSGVMAWIWVVVAWIGIKSFKHAPIQGDDT